MPRSRWLLMCLIAAALAVPASALEVRQALWGFDGRVKTGAFNPVSILISNPSGATYTSVLRLQQEQGAGSPVGAALVAPTVLSAGASRWVQFYPFVATPNEEWVLSSDRDPASGEGGLHYSLERPNLIPGAGARVLLDSGDLAAAGGARLKRFPEALFPPTVGALDGLSDVVLDHAPRWEPVKRQALADWVRRGGTVHVVLDENGRQPQFSDELAVLNGPLERQRVGAGLVVRHAVGRREIGEAQLGGAPAGAASDPNGQAYGYDDMLMGQLRELTTPVYHWVAIFIICGVYFLVVGPANLLIGKVARDYRVAVGFLLASVLVFTCVFFTIGRLGRANTAVTHTLSEARPLDEGTWDLTQWSSVFVTRGDQYSITHASPHNLYATGHESEAVNGVILNGKDGRLDVDIPLFSWREFIHRGQMKAPAFGAGVKAVLRDWPASTGRVKLQLAPGQGFPPHALATWAVYESNWFEMTPQPDGTLSGMSAPMNEAMSELQHPARTTTSWRSPGFALGRQAQDDPDNRLLVESAFRQMAKLVVSRDLGLPAPNQFVPSGPSPSPPVAATRDRIDLFVLDHSPESFNLAAPGLTREVGYVLYHLVLPVPEQ